MRKKKKMIDFLYFFLGLWLFLIFFSWAIFILALAELAILRDWGTGQATRSALTFHSTASG